MKYLAQLILLVALSGCYTVTIHPDATPKRIDEPNYQERYDYYLFGLIGENDVDVTQICSNKGVVQMQAQNTFVDVLLHIITLEIYTPRTAKVWCES